MTCGILQSLLSFVLFFVTIESSVQALHGNKTFSAAYSSTKIIVYGSITPATPTEAPTASPNSNYCSCSSCCGCSHVNIPTDVITIADLAFNQCGGGTELEEVIVITTITIHGTSDIIIICYKIFSTTVRLYDHACELIPFELIR